jgi:hypothetical protein
LAPLTIAAFIAAHFSSVMPSTGLSSPLAAAAGGVGLLLALHLAHAPVHLALRDLLDRAVLAREHRVDRVAHALPVRPIADAVAGHDLGATLVGAAEHALGLHVLDGVEERLLVVGIEPGGVELLVGVGRWGASSWS